MKLKTEAQLKKIQPTSKDQWIMVDNICTGLYLRVTPKGAKSLYYRYSINSKQRKLFLGTSPTLPLYEAKRQHVKYYDEVRSGIDIVQVRQEQKAMSIRFRSMVALSYL